MTSLLVRLASSSWLSVVLQFSGQSCRGERERSGHHRTRRRVDRTVHSPTGGGIVTSFRTGEKRIHGIARRPPKAAMTMAGYSPRASPKSADDSKSDLVQPEVPDRIQHEKGEQGRREEIRGSRAACDRPKPAVPKHHPKAFTDFLWDGPPLGGLWHRLGLSNAGHEASGEEERYAIEGHRGRIPECPDDKARKDRSADLSRRVGRLEFAVPLDNLVTRD